MKIISKLILIGALFCCVLPLYAQSDINFKANIIRKIAEDLTFPTSVTKGDEFIIGVVGDIGTVDAFKANMAGNIKNKKIVVQQITAASQINYFPIIYFTENASMIIAPILRVIASKPMLLITEKPGFAEKGVDVNLVKQGSVWGYEINSDRMSIKGVFGNSKFKERAFRTITKTVSSAELEKPNLINKPTVIREVEVRTIENTDRIRVLENRLKQEIDDKNRVEIAKRIESIKGSQDLADLRIGLDTITNLVTLRDRALEEAKKAQNEKLNRIKAENDTKEKEQKGKREREVANQRIFVTTLVGILGGVLAVISTIAILTFVANQRRKKIIVQLKTAKNLLAESNQQLDTQNKEIQTQSVVIQEKSAKITDSIRYAMTIQAAMLPSEKELSTIFNDHFVMYKPKDIVSGDFYWVTKRKEGAFLAVADCTGHGVPGAFLSTVGNDVLNEIVKDKLIFEPNEILSNLHMGIFERLKQGESQNKDGMDICLCRITEVDNQMCKIVFAGAKRPIYYSENGDIKTIKGDSKYLGGIQEEAPVFINHTIVLKKGEKIYLTTDGYADTPNPEKRKFGSVKFQELMGELYPKPLSEQHKIFVERWEKHKNGAELRDDTTILAIEI